MKSEQSKKLKVGDRVRYFSNEGDHGTVVDAQFRYVTIKWDDGHKSFTGHNEMQRVERTK